MLIILNFEYMRAYPWRAALPILGLAACITLLVLSASLLIKGQAHAQDSDNVRDVTVIARNGQGDYVPNTSFTIYRQVQDVDGRPKPGKSVASGKIDPVLGKGEVSFRDDLENSDANGYCMKMVAPQTSQEFWFYGNYSFPKADQTEVTEYLSGIKFIFRTMEGELIKDASFTLYTQKYDIDGEPIKQKDERIGSFSNTETGEIMVYVPSSANTIDGQGADHYIFQSDYNGGTYTMYDIAVTEGSVTDIEYRYSDIKLILENHEGIRFPGNTTVEIYEQNLDENNDYELSGKVGETKTNDEGIAFFSHPAGLYAARIAGADNQEQIFWDLDIIDQEREVYTLATDENWRPAGGACEAETGLTLVTKNLAGEHIPGLGYVLYEQTTDADGEPAIGPQVFSGQVNEHGRGLETFNPDPRKKYILKIYDQDKKVGAFWYYDLAFSCGEDREITKKLPALNVVLRNGDNDLLKNNRFSLYTQKTDVDGNPIKQKDSLVSRPKTSEKGVATLYVGFGRPYDEKRNGTYVFSAQFNGKEYNKYGIKVTPDQNIDFEYLFSDIILEVKDAQGGSYPDKRIRLHEQATNLKGDYELGQRLAANKTDKNGEDLFQHPAGYYAAAMKDSSGRDITFWNVHIKDRMRSYQTLKPNLTRIHLKTEASVPKVHIYKLKEESDNIFARDKKIMAQKVKETDYADINLAQGPYLAVDKHNQDEFGQAFYAMNGKFQEISIARTQNYSLDAGQRFRLEKPATTRTLSERLKGHILLQVEGRGEAWYVNPNDRKRYYMKDGETAYDMMRNFGLGITTADLQKIPLGVNKRFEGNDYDADYVPDKMEEAIGTDPRAADSDGDGYDDGTEIAHDYNPLGPGKLDVNKDLAERLKGKILLQVESRGEAWYINPKDGRRYYMKDGESAYQIMRYLSLGITNANLKKIPQGNIQDE